MKVNGCDCSIVIKTKHHEFDMQAAEGGVVQSYSIHTPPEGRPVPYSEETIREAVSVLQEEATIEGDGVCRAIQKKSGVTGCIVTPLTIDTAPLLLYLAMGSAGYPRTKGSMFVSETRNLHRYQLTLKPIENSDGFDLIQDRKNERNLFENCRVIGFELRFEREQAIKLKADIISELTAVIYPYIETFEKASGEKFNSNNVSYEINSKEYKNIYGLTLSCKKEGGTKTELWIKRVLQNGSELPNNIEKLVITASLLRDKYEKRFYGMFRITLKNLVMVSDETNVNSADTVIGPIRYYVAGIVDTEVFISGDEVIP